MLSKNFIDLSLKFRSETLHSFCQKLRRNLFKNLTFLIRNVTKNIQRNSFKKSRQKLNWNLAKIIAKNSEEIL